MSNQANCCRFTVLIVGLQLLSTLNLSLLAAQISAIIVQYLALYLACFVLSASVMHAHRIDITRRVCRGACVLTICDIWRGEVVIDKKGRVFGHAQVNDIRSGLQGSHCILMRYLLQTGGVHLMNSTVA